MDKLIKSDACQATGHEPEGLQRQAEEILYEEHIKDLAALRPALNLCMGAGLPMSVCLSQDLHMLFNDSWQSLMNDGAVLGKPVQEACPLLWDKIGACCREVLEKGEPLLVKEVLLPLTRNGLQEERYFDCSLSPLKDADGRVVGLMNTLVETSYQVINARRNQLLSTLSEKIQACKSISQLVERAAACLKPAEKDLPFFAFFGLGHGSEAVTGGLTAEEWASLKNNLPESLNKEGQLITLEEKLKPAPGKSAAGTQVFILPITYSAESQSVYFLAGINPQQEFTAEYRNFLTSIGQLVGAAWREAASVSLPGKKYAALQQLLFHAPVGVAIYNGPDFVVEMVNDLICEMVDRRLEELIDRPVFEVMTESAEDGFQEILTNVLTTGKPFMGKEMPVNIRRKGEVCLCYFNLSFQPLLDEYGKSDSILCIANEVTDQVKARQAVESIARDFEDLANAMPQIVWTADAQGDLYYFNDIWFAYSGMDYASSEKDGWGASIHPDDLPGLLTVWNHSLATGQDYQVEARIRDKKGDYYWFLIRAQALKDENGKVLKWIGTNTNITEYKQLVQDLGISSKKLAELNHRLRKTNRALQKKSEEQQTLIAMVENSAEFIGLASPKGKGMYLNRAGRSLVGLDHNARIEEYAMDRFFPAEDLLRMQEEIIPALRKKGFWRGEVNFRHIITGEKIPMLYTAFVVIDPKNGEPLGYATVSADIREQKQREAELQGYREELLQANQRLQLANQELKSTNDGMVETNIQLSRINAELDNFVYTASHDLKAPITNIEGLMHALERKLNTATKEEEVVRKLIGMIYSSVDRFKQTLSDLSDITQLQNSLRESAILLSPREVLRDVELDLDQQIKDSNATIRYYFQDTPPICFSRQNLKSIFYNLLSNAIKYRDPARRLEVDIRWELEDEQFLLTITDNGLGIQEVNEEKIFGMFNRLHSHVEGSGVGLYIVKKIMDNLGGQIKVHSSAGEGTTFTLTFPKDYLAQKA